MKFCPECGTPVDGMKFCPECGYKLTVSNNCEAEVTQNDTPPEPDIYEPLIAYYPGAKYHHTYKVGAILFDDITKTIKLSRFKGKRQVFDYRDIEGYDLIKDGATFQESGGFGIKRAAVGGALFGVAGALAGGLTKKGKHKTVISSLGIQIYLNDLDTPAVFMGISKDTDSSAMIVGVTEKRSIKIATAIDRIKKVGLSTDISDLDIDEEIEERRISNELAKLKEQYMAGEISKEEYNNKKYDLES